MPSQTPPPSKTSGLPHGQFSEHQVLKKRYHAKFGVWPPMRQIPAPNTPEESSKQLQQMKEALASGEPVLEWAEFQKARKEQWDEDEKMIQDAAKHGVDIHLSHH